MEQTLGHVTHYQNLQAVVAEQLRISPTWIPIPFDLDRITGLVPLVRSNWSVRASWRARRALGRALAAEPHDAVVFHTQVPALFSHTTMRRVPTVVSLDATPLNYDSVSNAYGHRPAAGRWDDRLAYALNRRTFHAAGYLVAWSTWARDSLIDNYDVHPSRVRILAPGAAPTFFALGEQRTAGPVPGAPGDGLPRVLFVGGDFRRKGGTYLLDIMRGSLGDRCELHLVTNAAVPTQRNVHVHRGLTPNSPTLRALFASADIFVLPSLGECLAVVLMEATAAGLPVITTDVGALPEAVEPGASGLVVPAGDAGALRAALMAVVDDPDRRARMGRAGYALATRLFDARKNNLALLDLVAAASAERQHGRQAA